MSQENRKWRQGRARIREILNLETSPGAIIAEGWVRSVRYGKGVTFLALNDGSCLATLQAVFESTALSAEKLAGLGTGACVRVCGPLVESPGSGQRWEVQAREITVLGPVDESYPLQKKRHGLEFLREVAHLRPRTNLFGAIFRVRSKLAFAIHRFFRERDFLYVHTPIITANDCEGAGELFHVTTFDPFRPAGESPVAWRDDFFGEKTGLTVSGQLEGELFAMAFTDVYTFGPTFRAENSNTRRHAAEFWMIEPEMAFADLQDDCDLAEEFLREMVNCMLKECPEELAFCEQFVAPGVTGRLEAVARSHCFARMTYTEAVGHLQRSGQPFTFPVEWGGDLQSEHERYLTENVVNGPLFVTDYPAELKAFYMRGNDDGRTVAAMDLLVPQVGELIGGSQREERLEVLERRMRACGMTPGELNWYLDTRRWGGCPHAGFGLGFERLLMYVTGMENIRDVIPFPRTPGNARF